MSSRFAHLGWKAATLTAALVMAAVVAVALSAAPQGRGAGAGRGQGFGPGPNRGPFGGLGPMGMMMGALDLTEAQKEQIKGIVQAQKTDVEARMKDEGQARQALEKAQLAGEPDQTIRQLHGNLAAVEADFAVAQTHLIAQVLQVLTPEQQANLKSMRERMEQRRADGRPHPQRPDKQ